MLKYILVKETAEQIVYEYFPEGGDAFGVVIYNTVSGSCTIQELADNDRYQIYALKLMKKIREFAKNNAFSRDGIIAWY